MRLFFVLVFSVGFSSVSHAQDTQSQINEGVKQAQSAIDSIGSARVNNASPTQSLISQGQSATQNDQTSVSKPAQGSYAAADASETAGYRQTANAASSFNPVTGSFEEKYYSDEQRAAHSRYPKVQEDRLKAQGTEVCKLVDETSNTDPHELRYCVDHYMMYYRPGSSVAKLNPNFIMKENKPVTIFWADATDQPEGSYQCKSTQDGYLINCKRGIQKVSAGVADTNSSNQLKGTPDSHPMPGNDNVFEQRLSRFLPPPAN